MEEKTIVDGRTPFERMVDALDGALEVLSHVEVAVKKDCTPYTLGLLESAISNVRKVYDALATDYTRDKQECARCGHENYVIYMDAGKPICQNCYANKDRLSRQ